MRTEGLGSRLFVPEMESIFAENGTAFGETASGRLGEWAKRQWGGNASGVAARGKRAWAAAGASSRRD